MYPALLMFSRIYLNLLLLVSPARLFNTIIKADAYNNVLIEWINKLAFTGNLQILEIGCGPGVLACHLTTLGHKVTGLDLSANMINKAIKESKSQNTSVSFINSSADDTGLTSASFNSVIGASIINVLNEPLLTLKETKRLLHPDGITSFLFPTEEMTVHRVRQYASKKQYSAFSTAVLMTWAGKARKMQPDTMVKMFSDSGFINTRAFSTMEGMVSFVTACKES